MTIADNENHIDKRGFKVPFVCGARNLGEALRRIAEGAAMIRTKGEAGTGKRAKSLPFFIPVRKVKFEERESELKMGWIKKRRSECLVDKQKGEGKYFGTPGVGIR